jgi:ribosome recycling factor
MLTLEHGQKFTVPPSKSERRIEAVVVIAEAVSGERLISAREIVRDASGKVTKLKPDTNAAQGRVDTIFQLVPTQPLDDETVESARVLLELCQASGMWDKYIYTINNR